MKSFRYFAGAAVAVVLMATTTQAQTVTTAREAVDALNTRLKQVEEVVNELSTRLVNTELTLEELRQDQTTNTPQTYVWVNADGRTTNPMDACATVDAQLAPQDGRVICASGSAQPRFHDGHESINYTYGKRDDYPNPGGEMLNRDKETGTFYCYAPGPKFFTTRETDVAVAYLCVK